MLFSSIRRRIGQAVEALAIALCMCELVAAMFFMFLGWTLTGLR